MTGSGENLEASSELPDRGLEVMIEVGEALLPNALSTCCGARVVSDVPDASVSLMDPVPNVEVLWYIPRSDHYNYVCRAGPLLPSLSKRRYELRGRRRVLAGGIEAHRWGNVGLALVDRRDLCWRDRDQPHA